MKMATAGKVKSKDRRHEAILAELRASPAIRIVELATAFRVSTETIRRDLDELSSAGLVSRTYGGATGALLSSEPPLDDRYGMNELQRLAMAKSVVKLVREGDSLMIDAGATTIYVARRLAAEFNDLTIVTTSFGVASAFAANPQIRVRMCPGDYDRRDGGVSGSDTVEYLKQFHASRTIISASRLDQDGPSDFNPNSVWIKRAMIQSSDEAILVLDHDKLEKIAFERICPLPDIRWLVTDRQPPAKLGEALHDAKVNVCVPDVSEI